MLKGKEPKNSSKAKIPIAHKSTFSSYFYPWSNSGDKYRGVPQKVALNSYFLLTAHPKSHSFTFPYIIIHLHEQAQCFTVWCLYARFCSCAWGRRHQGGCRWWRRCFPRIEFVRWIWCHRAAHRSLAQVRYRSFLNQQSSRRSWWCWGDPKKIEFSTIW